MADWKFTDDYATRYPALTQSILSLLAFSGHALSGTQFTGTLDVAASGVGLETIGGLLEVTSIAVSGTVTEANGTLTVSLKSTASFTGALEKIPIIGSRITDAYLTLSTVVHTTDPADDAPPTDAFTLAVTFKLTETQKVTITAPVPYNGGLFMVTGTFSGVAITLQDIDYLMGKAGGSGQSWFPTTELGPYTAGSPAFELLSVTLTLNATLQPFTLSLSAITVVIGITGIPVMDKQLYLNPLAVRVMVLDPTGTGNVSWGIEGSLVLCNYATPGNLENPDFIFEFDLGLTDFSFSAELENPGAKPVNVMIQDLLGKGTSVGLSDTLTINSFTFDAIADKTSGSLDELSTQLAMSGGFGLLESFDFESIFISLTYSPS